GVVLDLAVFDHTAVSVACILAEADVRDHGKIGRLVLDGFDRVLDDSLIRVRFAPDFVLVLREPEEYNRRNSEILHFLAVPHDIVDGLLVLSGHGIDLFFHASAVRYEKRIDKIVRREFYLSYHSSNVFICAQPSWSIYRLEHRASK